MAMHVNEEMYYLQYRVKFRNKRLKHWEIFDLGFRSTWANQQCMAVESVFS